MNRFLITIICLGVAVVLGVFFLWPRYQDFQILQANIENKESELQSKKEYFSQIREAAEKLQDYKENLSKISSALPSAPDVSSLFNFLQNISSEAGLVLEETKLVRIDSQKTAGLKEIIIDIELKGSYSAFDSFLSALEKSSRLIEVSKISFSIPKETGDPFSFEVSLKSQSY
ncbi:MAG: type 4a pilus biogenesis protein PilO [Candidatus Nealsonbacteria bacterium]